MSREIADKRTSTGSDSPVVSGMSDGDFNRLRQFIEAELGIRMPPSKRVMLESRLSRRLRQLGLQSYGDYADLVFSPEGSRTELIQMIDAVTTNKTDFFREADHFDYLLNQLLPSYFPKNGGPLRLWSAGCSTGEEAYTLAMVMEEHRRKVPAFQYSIFASDISTRVIAQAVNGVYEAEKVASIPLDYKKRYFLRSKDSSRALVRIKPELRAKIEFRRLNLMDEEYQIPWKFDVIFCRNVIIYFERPVQEGLIQKLYGALHEGGTLFLGHSETITGMRVPFRSVAPTVYKKV